MALPPQQIRIKRKHVEETPVTFLQLEQSETNKRHRSGRHWVYRRQDAATVQDEVAGAAASAPVIRTSQPGDERRAVLKSGPILTVTPPPSTNNPVDGDATYYAAALPGEPPPREGGRDETRRPIAEPRRFHMSKAALSSLARTQHPGGGGIGKRDRNGPVFVEQRKKKVLRKRLGTLSAQAKDQGQALLTGGGDDDVQMTDASSGDGGATTGKKPPHKRPNTKSRSSSRRPLPHLDRLSDDTARVSAEVDRWVLGEIAAALEEEAARTAADAPKADGKPKFKPRAPAQRFADRHPNHALSSDGSAAGDCGSDGEESGEDTADDGEVVYDTYVRVPADSVSKHVATDDVGYLVIRSGEEEERFYYGGEVDSGEEDGEESDENAENHFSTDYPEDEVESDDEYGRAAYAYRNGNASDEEEYDGSGSGSDSGPGLGSGAEPVLGPDSSVVEDEDLGSAMAKIRRFNQRHDVFG